MQNASISTEFEPFEKPLSGSLAFEITQLVVKLTGFVLNCVGIIGHVQLLNFDEFFHTILRFSPATANASKTKQKK